MRKLADEPSVGYQSRFCVGGVSIRVAGECPEDVDLVPSLVPFQVKTGISDINIQVIWMGDLIQTSAAQLFDSGSVWCLYDKESGFQFDFNSPSLGDHPYKRLIVDSHFRQATLQMNRACFEGVVCASEPLEYPLDELLIMHRLTQEKAIELHGCGIVGPDGVGNLFVGHSEAGKSTTTRLWTAHENVEVLSDDRIIVRDDKGKTDSQMSMYGTPWHGEAMFASPASAPLSRILILEHGHGNVLTRLSKSQAVAELFARSFVPFHRHEYVSSALTFLEEVADSIPCYRYSFEPDDRAVKTILNFHD